MSNFKVGEIYWFKNEYAGRNMQSCGELIEWISEDKAVMYNKRYGKIIVTEDNLLKHN